MLERFGKIHSARRLILQHLNCILKVILTIKKLYTRYCTLEKNILCISTTRDFSPQCAITYMVLAIRKNNFHIIKSEFTYSGDQIKELDVLGLLFPPAITHQRLAIVTNVLSCRRVGIPI